MHAMISQKRLRWVEHALRCDTTDLSRQNVQNQLTKPDLRWTQLITSDCAAARIDFCDLERLATKRIPVRQLASARS